jgi:hypothetical protein
MKNLPPELVPQLAIPPTEKLVRDASAVIRTALTPDSALPWLLACCTEPNKTTVIATTLTLCDGMLLAATVLARLGEIAVVEGNTSVMLRCERAQRALGVTPHSITGGTWPMDGAP